MESAAGAVEGPAPRKISRMDLGTVLGVWAHPDDETYLTAGLMARTVRDGGRVVCVTATRGEEGSFDEELWPSERMGAVREAELLRSLEVLGVRELKLAAIQEHVSQVKGMVQAFGADFFRSGMRAETFRLGAEAPGARVAT